MGNNHLKKRSQAAALKYDPFKNDAPIISALGVGHVADRIIETGRTHNVPIVENRPLSDVLATLSVGDAIPPNLYEAVAQVLVFVSQKDQDFGQKLQY